MTGSLSFAFWRDRMGNFVQRPDVADVEGRMKVVDAGVPGPTPGGLPGLTDAEAEAFIAAIDRSGPPARCGACRDLSHVHNFGPGCHAKTPIVEEAKP